MAKVGFHGVRKSYGATAVIHGIDMQVADGEFVVIVGPSGCGKSTLLRMVAGLEGISGGDIAIGERVVNDLEPKDRDIAMVFQNYALYPHMSVFDNMAYGLKIRGFARDDIRERVNRAAEILELGPLLARKPGQLSGGQRQRVAMGRAIVREPAVFLFDEPLSNLDAKLRVAMRAEIKSLHQRLKTTTVYVTHDQVEAMTMADRIVILNAGKIEQIGSPLQLYHDPQTRFVAGFLGAPAMNFLSVDVVGDAIRLPGGGNLSRPGIRQGRAELGVRPERIRVVSQEGEAHMRGIVSVIEPLGADTLVALDCGGEKVVARLPGDISLRLSAPVLLALEPESIVLFDPQTGLRL